MAAIALNEAQHRELMAAIDASIAGEHNAQQLDQELEIALALSVEDQKAAEEDRAWLLAFTGVEVKGQCQEDVLTMQMLMRECLEAQQQAYLQVRSQQQQTTADDVALAATLALLEQERQAQIEADAVLARKM
jgi:predicted GH43/DUF377 family glycosyl hydrolase